MKINLLFSASILCAVIVISSCKKDAITTTPVNPCAPVVMRDTIFIQPPSRLQILTAKIWEIDEVNRNNSGSNSRYIKGGTNTTGTSYNLLKIKFNLDGTGTYTDEVGISHTLNWLFTGTGQRNIKLSIGPPSATTFVWYTVEINENYMHQTSVSGSNSLLSSRYIQVP